MRRNIFIILTLVILLVMCTFPAFAGGGKVRGDKGTGITNLNRYYANFQWTP